MDDLRLDIVSLAHGWVLTDSGTRSRVFRSSGSAIDEAKRIARGHAGRVTVFVWNGPTETKIFDSANKAHNDWAASL